MFDLIHVIVFITILDRENCHELVIQFYKFIHMYQPIVQNKIYKYTFVLNIDKVNIFIFVNFVESQLKKHGSLTKSFSIVLRHR